MLLYPKEGLFPRILLCFGHGIVWLRCLFVSRLDLPALQTPLTSSLSCLTLPSFMFMAVFVVLTQVLLSGFLTFGIIFDRLFVPCLTLCLFYNLELCSMLLNLSAQVLNKSSNCTYACLQPAFLMVCLMKCYMLPSLGGLSWDRDFFFCLSETFAWLNKDYKIK